MGRRPDRGLGDAAAVSAPNPSLQAALLSGSKRYRGVVCAKHPELRGERNVRSRGCTQCNREQMRQRRAANPEYHRALTRAAYLKGRDRYLEASRRRGRERRTGVPHEMWEAMMEAQGGKCAICQKKVSGRSAHTDHCHTTGVVRGVLCSTCNQAEGLILRTGLPVTEFSARLHDYLENPPAARLKGWSQ